MKRNLSILSSSMLLAIAMSTLAGCRFSRGRHGEVKGKFNISISAPRDEANQQILKILKRAYEEKHPDTNVIVESWGSLENSENYISQYALNRSQLSNIIYTTDDITSVIAQKNNFVDLRPFFERDPETDYTNYYESMLHTTAYNGEFRPTTSYNGAYSCPNGKSDEKQYGIFFSPREYNMPGLVLNVDAFNKIGVDLPSKENWDFNAFVELLRDISNAIKDKAEVQHLNEFNVYRGIELNQCWEPMYTTFMKHFNTDGLFKTDNNGDPMSNITSDVNIEAFKSIVSAFGNGEYKYAIDQDLSNEDFPANTILMCAVSLPAVASYVQSVKNIQFMPLPFEYVGAGCGGYGILVDRCTDTDIQTVNGESRKTVDICWDFLKFSLSEEGQNLCGAPGYVQPVLKKLEKTGDWLKSYDESLDHTAFCSAKELRLSTYYFAEPTLRKTLRNLVNALFYDLFAPNTKNSDVVSIAEQADNEIRNALK